jgi:hypothetical protein
MTLDLIMFKQCFSHGWVNHIKDASKFTRMVNCEVLGFNVIPTPRTDRAGDWPPKGAVCLLPYA